VSGKVQYGQAVLRPQEHPYGQRYYSCGPFQVEREGLGERGGRPFVWCVYRPDLRGALPIARYATLRECARYIDAQLQGEK